MKKLLYPGFLSIVMLTLSFCTSSTGKDNQQLKNSQSNNINPDKNIAVLELFTSQGCSSCPPADRLLGTYTSKENIIPLSFHVDYWDRLGWKDPFSSKEYTQRQYKYASALHASVYTPQLVINGQVEMIGSDANKISSAINKILSEASQAVLSIKTVNEENGKVNIRFDVSGTTGNSDAKIALVENKTTTAVKGGENGGATLTNYNVVRNFKTINKFEAGENTCTIDIPASSDLKNLSVVIFLQQKNNNIIAADKKEL
jgi:hypothetical protein